MIVVECKGGPIKRRFYHVVNALGQVLVVKAHYPKFEVAIAVPERWGKDCLSDAIRERYDVRLWLVFTSQRTILNVDEGEFLE